MNGVGYSKASGYGFHEESRDHIHYRIPLENKAYLLSSPLMRETITYTSSEVKHSSAESQSLISTVGFWRALITLGTGIAWSTARGVTRGH